MDGNDRRRTQYGQPYQTPPQSRPLPGQPMGPPSGDRYAQPNTPARSDIGGSSLTRPYLPGYPGYSFQEQQYATTQIQGGSPMQGVQMQYSPAYIQEASRQQQVPSSPSQQQQQQQYTQYGPGPMLPPVGPQSLYENIPYQQRQTALEVMASQFAVPQYIPQGEHGGLGVGSSSSQYLTTQSEQDVYGGVPVTRGPLHPAYPGAQVDFPQVEPRPAQGAIEPDTNQEVLQQGLRDYRQQIKLTFDAIVAGRVTEASDKVLAATRWLVASVSALGEFTTNLLGEQALIVQGLQHDDENRYEERIELWTELNLCWEAIAQKQKEITEEALRTTRLPADILSGETITHLVDELVSLCDQLEQYGLVDFELGIWEEQIIHIFTVCLDLLPRSGLTGQTGRSQAGPS
ncbi:hypothetical protein LTR99_000953 [Exophiala xenobiotica]|uniref:Uncharacterized protein n=1 Tax=Vermiconidia calcicola TaxID=1690605 RepID=A0AAV9QMN8_9PEZI|nr:hypothetical protein LTR92_001385 [Exophiala xenobiotica]KAK5540703.1 hypothetical protein LTR23_005934 [Chaetothyriales sp. CCFEE 6169]KAK5545516.1 hypothetical protein LTR25_000523 [Vermiconidia calcicola]KAK5208433.1 hypothetical protein LTR41_005659 [Exophiala xenobiotica]KAK5230102.1 hypothetical protein LTR72_001637 [Exophiala xenobiotica]